MKFNILLATYDRPHLLRRLLESLAEARFPEGFERVMVVENGKPAGAEQVCEEVRERLPIEYRFVPEPGKGRALQHGLEILRDGFVLFLDDDVRVSPELLTAYAAAAREHGQDVIYGGPVAVDYEADPPPAWLLPYLPASAKGRGSSDRWPLFLGMNYGAFVERVLAVGGMSLDIGPGARCAGTKHNPTGLEDEVQKRLIEDGCRLVFLPEARVWHYVPAESCTSDWALHRQYRMAITDAMEYERTYQGPRWFGAPRWSWRALATSSARALAAPLTRDERRRFELLVGFYRNRGFVHGARIAARQRTSDARKTAHQADPPGDGVSPAVSYRSQPRSKR